MARVACRENLLNPQKTLQYNIAELKTKRRNGEKSFYYYRKGPRRVQDPASKKIERAIVWSCENVSEVSSIYLGF